MNKISNLLANNIITASNLLAQSEQRSTWPIRDLQGIQILESPLLSEIPGLVHAFTTRKGGTSSAPLDSFNLGRHRIDQESKDDAMRNRQKLCEVLKVDFERLCTPAQEHTTTITWIAPQDEVGQGPEKFQSMDGLATAARQTPLLLSFADCVPIILVVAQPRAVAVVHAGWRGTANGIARQAVNLLQSKTGCAAGFIKAAIGPCIGPCCFETGIDVAEQLANSLQIPNQQIQVNKLATTFPDLKSMNALQLLQSGIEDLDISDSCTACTSQMFYSHRQSKGQTGRQGALACLV